MVEQRWRHRIAVASVLAGLVLVAVTLLGLWRYATRDHVDVVDDPLVLRTSNAACLVMRRSVHQLAPPSEASIPQRVKAIRAQNQAVGLMVEQIRGVGADLVEDDQPVPGWLDDWEALVRARETYAAALAKRTSGALSLKVPVDEEGQSIVTRMNDVGLDCAVPAELLSN